MNTLNKKIKAVIGTKERYIYLTADELLALTRMNKVKCFNMQTALDRFDAIGSDTYYQGVGSITLKRSQAKELATSFSDFNERGGKELFSRIYISEMSETGGYFVSM